MTLRNTGLFVVLFVLGAACTGQPAPAPIKATMTTVTSDDVTIYGEVYFGELDATAPLVLLFHQGGSNGRGEYAEIAQWLNEAGFRAIAWDQRAGGETYGKANRTALGLAEGVPDGYCDTYPDLLAALDHVLEEALADQVFVWGSSYSAALVFRLAKERPDKIKGLLAFSPASGGPLQECRARMWIDEVTTPVYIFRPASEMERESSVEQKELLTAAGASFLVVEHGVHGSSMLVDARTEHDMESTRETIISWMKDLAAR